SKEAVKIANQVGNAELLSVARMRRMETAYVLGQDELAVELAEVYAKAPANSPVVISIRDTASARVFALSAHDEKRRTNVRSLADKRPTFGDSYYAFFDTGIWSIRKAQALLNLSVHALNASGLLREAEGLLDHVDQSLHIDGFSTSASMLSLRLTQARVALAS